MSLRTFVKIGNVNNLSDARYCAGMSVDLIGFNIDPEIKNHVTPASFREITDWISGIEFVGEFETDNAQIIIDTVKDYQVDFIQISHPQLLHEIGMTGLSVILKMDLVNYSDQNRLIEDLNYSKTMVAFFLIEGTNDTINKELFYSHASEFSLLIGSGISKTNVNGLIEKFSIKGISLNGGDEIKPGYKDYDELADILESIEVEDFD